MISITLKLLQGILKGSKREKWAEHLTPEKLGELAATKVRLWLDNTSTLDGTIGAVTEEEIKQLANDSPAAIQSLLVASLDVPQSASEETSQILESYVAVLNPIAEALRSLETSIALRGFLHDAECVSYWHLANKQEKDAAFRKVGNHLVIGGGFEIYILNVYPTDDVLDALNATIRSERSRQLPSGFCDYRRDESVGKLEDVHELSVTLRQLDPERDVKQAKAKSDPFGGHA